MEERSRTVARNAATAVIAAIIGGAVVYAWLAPTKDELARVSVARDTLSMEVKTLNERLRPLESDKLALEKKSAEFTAELDRMRTALAEKEQALAKARSESESLAKKFAGMGVKVTASAAEREKLARELEATGKRLDEAKARAAELNKSYEALLKEQKQLAATDTARTAELERTKKALEEAQTEVARLTGARGIYTVQDGDHLSKIAVFFYHKGNRWPDIFQANAFLISSPDLIYPRQVLIIPQ
jgi:nucleoid-associated protein YgaU